MKSRVVDQILWLISSNSFLFPWLSHFHILPLFDHDDDGDDLEWSFPKTEQKLLQSKMLSIVQLVQNGVHHPPPFYKLKNDPWNDTNDISIVHFEVFNTKSCICYI